MLKTVSPLDQELERTRLKVRCAQLYYGLVPGLPGELRQSDVARRLGVPRSQVVVWLKEARERFIEIRLRAPRAASLELPLAQRLLPFGVSEVRVVVDGGLSAEGTRDAAGAEAARWLSGVLFPGARLGLAGGRTLLACVRELARQPLPTLSLFPLAAGGPLAVSANGLVAGLAGAGGPGTAAHGLWVPPLVPGRRGDLQAFLRRPEVRAVYRSAQRVDLALLGIGAVEGPEAVQGMRDYLGATAAAARRMGRSAARGFILQQFIDGSGRDHPCALGERNLAVPLASIRRLAAAAALPGGPLRNGQRPRGVALVAAGPTKLKAVAAAVRGRLLNVLVVDTAIAEGLLSAVGR